MKFSKYNNIFKLIKENKVSNEEAMVQNLTETISSRLKDLTFSELKLVNDKIEKILEILGENKMELIVEILKALYTDPREIE